VCEHQGPVLAERETDINSSHRLLGLIFLLTGYNCCYGVLGINTCKTTLNSPQRAKLYKAKKQMASGVFGVPISVATVRATGEYKEPITQNDVADYAMKMINAGGKDTDAQKYVDNLKDRFVCGLFSDVD